MGDKKWNCLSDKTPKNLAQTAGTVIDIITIMVMMVDGQQKIMEKQNTGLLDLYYEHRCPLCKSLDKTIEIKKILCLPSIMYHMQVQMYYRTLYNGHE